MKGFRERETVYHLVAGQHRLEACKSLGWREIPAVLTEEPELKRRLWEIDENLCRAELSHLEKGEHLVERKAIYEALHPETRQGAQGGRGGHRNENDKMSFSKDTGAKTGRSERDIQRAVRRATKILPEVRDSIRGIEGVAGAEAKHRRATDKMSFAEETAARTGVSGMQGFTTAPDSATGKFRESWGRSHRDREAEPVSSSATSACLLDRPEGDCEPHLGI